MRAALGTLCAALLAATAAATAAAQEHGQPATGAGDQSRYAELMRRDIKALSPEQIAQYRAGEGMGFALAAELNHHPGPRHVLQLASELGLSPDQQRAIGAARDSMSAAAIRLGETIIGRERELDRAFADRAMTPERLRELTLEIGRLTGELRAAHLAAHLAVARVLTSDQVARYDALRGYASGQEHRH